MKSLSGKLNVIIIGITVMLTILMSLRAFAVSIGQEGILESGAELVPVAVSKEAFDEWTKARVANDKYGMGLLLASGKILTPKRGTKVLVIDRATFIRKVRILEGEYVGMSGWVAVEYVKDVK